MKLLKPIKPMKKPSAPRFPKFRRGMARPLAYALFVRGVLSLLAALLWREYAGKRQVLPMQGWVTLFLCVFFICMAWLAYLRLTGLKLPAPDKRLFEWKRHPVRTYGDMADHMDDEPGQDDDLEDRERDVVRLLADAALGLAWLLVTLLLPNP